MTPRPASPFNWTVTVFDGQSHHLARVNTRRTEPLLRHGHAGLGGGSLERGGAEAARVHRLENGVRRPV